jgi:hypothetical protein
MFYFQFMLDRIPLSKAERLSVGSLGGVAVLTKSCKDDVSSARICSASERTHVAERGKEKQHKMKLELT